MAKIISFISRKGGTGKTTNAINLATSLHSKKKKIALIETDPNYTLMATRKMEVYKRKLDESKLFSIVGSTDNEVAIEIDNQKNTSQLDYIIVDSAGKTTDRGIKELCLASDMVIVTTGLTQNDLLVAYQTIKDLKPAQKLKPTMQLFILPNRIHFHTRLKTVKDVLENLGVDMFDCYVPQKKIFTTPSTVYPEKRYRMISSQIIDKL